MQLRPIGRKGMTGPMLAAIGGVIGFVILIVVVTMGAQVTQSVKDSQTANSAAANISGNGLTGLTNTSSQFGSVGTVLMLALIIGVLIGGVGIYLYGKNR